MADAREESSEDSSDSTSSDNFSIYTETSSSEEDLQNVEEPGTSTSSATTHNSRKGKSKSSSKQPTVKRSKRQQSFFAGKAYLKINSLVKTPLHEFIAAARSEILKVCAREEKLRRRRRSKFKGSGCVLHQKMFKFRVSEISSPVFSVNINEKKCSK